MSETDSKNGELGELPQDSEKVRFTGHQRDLGQLSTSQDDLDYMHARYYGTAMGRFVSTDPGGVEPSNSQSCEQRSQERFGTIVDSLMWKEARPGMLKGPLPVHPEDARRAQQQLGGVSTKPRSEQVVVAMVANLSWPRALRIGLWWFGLHGLLSTLLVLAYSSPLSWSWIAFRFAMCVDWPVWWIGRQLAAWAEPWIVKLIELSGLTLGQGTVLTAIVFSVVLGGIPYFAIGVLVSALRQRRRLRGRLEAEVAE